MRDTHHDHFDQQWLDEEMIGQAGNIPISATTIPDSSTAILLQKASCAHSLYTITLDSTA